MEDETISQSSATQVGNDLVGQYRHNCTHNMDALHTALCAFNHVKSVWLMLASATLTEREGGGEGGEERESLLSPQECSISLSPHTRVEGSGTSLFCQTGAEGFTVFFHVTPAKEKGPHCGRALSSWTNYSHSEAKRLNSPGFPSLYEMNKYTYL